ncbi:Cna B-type domain-containing protein [Peptococcus simiae]|uniref:Cna B-type domain-containing protein n=1 Tax=Peptococcus simiae TaxID=1643805 RepID=UPI003980659B
MKKPNKLLQALCLALVLSLLFTTGLPARAAEPQVGPEVSTPFGNMTFHLYRVAEKDPAGAWKPCPPFHTYALNLSLTTAEAKRTLSETLAAYILRDKPAPYQTVTADAGGKASFGKIPPGLYLVTGDGSADAIGRRPVPTLIEWPAQKTPAPPVRPKYNVPGSSGRTENLAIHAVKLWQDNRSPDRPKSIQVQLLQDGKVIETATLSAENNWRKDWYFLPRGHSYHVLEKDVPPGYSLTVSREGMTFTLTNTKGEEPKKPPQNPPGKTPPPDQPPQKPPQKPTPKLPPATGPKIPQTGQLWWPVMALALLGLGFSLKAYRASKNPQEDDR